MMGTRLQGHSLDQKIRESSYAKREEEPIYNYKRVIKEGDESKGCLKDSNYVKNKHKITYI